jgi:hypothetical protein
MRGELEGEKEGARGEECLYFAAAPTALELLGYSCTAPHTGQDNHQPFLHQSVVARPCHFSFELNGVCLHRLQGEKLSIYSCIQTRYTL